MRKLGEYAPIDTLRPKEPKISLTDPNRPASRGNVTEQPQFAVALPDELVPEWLGENTELEKSAMITSSDPSNKHLADYIQYYSSLEDPGYAVLVTGAWGVGKTYQLKAILPDAYYVSLFGLNSPDDVIYSAYAAMSPKKERVEKLLTTISEPVAKNLGINGLTPGLISAFFRREVSRDKPIIFDDLERCGLQPKVILGLINLYVEHHRCRVIVITHDEKLKKYFSKSKEKLFGQTIRVLPEIDAAYNSFIEPISKDISKKILEKNRGLIINVFKESKNQSLRVLKHLVLDIGRFLECLSDDHLSNDKALSEVLMLFSAFDIECRTGHLQETDLANREFTSLKHQGQKAEENDSPIPNIVRVNEKYKGIDLTNTLLDDQPLREMFVLGVFNPETIRSSLDASPFFSLEDTPKPWRIVIHFQELEDDIVNEGLARMESEFKDLKITEAGEMLHVFALKLLMASNGMSEKSIDEVTCECRKYINDLEETGELEPRNLDWRWRESFKYAAHGNVYWIEDAYRDNFNRIDLPPSGSLDLM